MSTPVTTDSALEQPESPTIRQLLADLAGRGATTEVLERFWQAAADAGTPLIESPDPESGTALATFLWRTQEDLDNVLLLEWMTGRSFHEKKMTRLSGTDVWYKSMRVRNDLRTTFSIAPNDSLKSRSEETDWPARFAKWTIDPLNKTPLLEPGSGPIGDSRYDSTSVLEMPNAPEQPWIVRDATIPAGRIQHHRFSSTVLENERDIWVYHPAADAGTEPGIVITFDGERAMDVLRQPIVYDNLAASGEVRPFYGVMIGNVDRSLELPCNPRFLEMLTAELLPWLSQHLGVTLSAERTVVGGASYGGLAAMYAGLHAPESFGRVVSQSGSFWWKPDPMNEEHPLRLGDAGDFAWLPHKAATMPLGDVAIWMEVGTLENLGHLELGPTQVSANRHMRDVLIARGIPVTYSEYAGGHDWACWRNSLAEGIIASIPAR